MRIGLGYDSHPFDSDRTLVLGGVTFPGQTGLGGHSDGDAVAHALIDALLGAAGLGSVGERFPDDDPRYAGADSVRLLEQAVREIESHNYQVVNVDVTVIAEHPRIRPRASEMSARLGRALHAPPDAVSVKGKSNEEMGWIGRGEGLAVLAVVLIDQISDIDALHASIRSGG